MLSINSINTDVSIHAPVWGATYVLMLVLTIYRFQSTHPCGVRPGDYVIAMVDHVSIHAPVWGATSLKRKKRLTLSFNPRTRVGCD